MNIFDLFSTAAKGVEAVPWRWRLMAGAAVGVGYQAFRGDPDTDFFDRITKGVLLGSVAGLAAGPAVKALGGFTTGTGRIAKWGITSKFSDVRAGIKEFGPWSAKSYKALMHPGFLALAGAGVGAAVAPEGHRMQGAAIGAGLGFMTMPVYHMAQGWKVLGNIPGAKTSTLIAAAALPVLGSAIVGRTLPETTATAIPGLGAQMDYEPLEGDMKSRMTALNASGDIVLGLHNRKHG